MPYDEDLAARIRKSLSSLKGVEEKKMFGGIAFMAKGKMAVGVNKEDLIVRCDPEKTDSLLAKKGAKPFSIGPKMKKGPPKGWLLIGPEGTKDASSLKYWMDVSL